MPSLLSRFFCLTTISVSALIITSAVDITSYDVSGGALSLISGGDPNDVTVQVSTDNSAQQAFFSLSGPADRWFGVGFGGSVMLDTYAIVVDEDGSVSERTLGSWSAGVLCGGFPGVQLQVTSNVAANNRRFVVGQHMMVRNCDTGNGFTVPGMADTFEVFGGYGVAGEAFLAAAAMGGHGSANYTTASVAGSVSGPLMSLIGVGGAEDVTVQVEADSATQTATISLSGPDARWFGVGFDRRVMFGAYAVVVYENGTAVEERVLGLHNNGAACDAQTLSVLSNTVLSGVRSLVVTRHLSASGTCVGGFDFLGTADSFNVFGGYGAGNGSFATDTAMGGHGHTQTPTGSTWMLYATSGATTAPAPTRRTRGGGTPTRASRGGGRGGGSRTPRPVTAAEAAEAGSASGALNEADADEDEDSEESESASSSSHSHLVPRSVSDAIAVLLMAVLAVVALSCSWCAVAYYLRQRTWKKLPVTTDEDERQPLLSGKSDI